MEEVHSVLHPAATQTTGDSPAFVEVLLWQTLQRPLKALAWALKEAGELEHLE